MGLPSGAMGLRQMLPKVPGAYPYLAGANSAQVLEQNTVYGKELVAV